MMRFATLTVCLVLGAGCINLDAPPDPTRYFIMNGPDTVDAEGGFAIHVSTVSLEPYLASPRIVVRLDENEVQFSDVHRWAEPLEENIQSVLEEYLAVSSIGTVTNRRPTERRLAVRVHVDRFEGQLPDQARFVALWSIEDAAGRALVKRRSDHTVSGWGGTDFEQLVGLLESTIALLADEIASAL